ncbi:hypothetical protein [Pseudoclavibacter sp. RFBA6]|uniref:hypothetical protein n=1 Tax=Pseudoclavibacter sp. RFBA6 TaxID=2080573 RepID=UPI000CE769DA|nr:hypothetical protein [Pseudoclavibacter sp. RFBA6]PPG38547.1 hypothetical protein C5C17_14630 [Pseudoclavibacter sp. RFBA6]
MTTTPSSTRPTTTTQDRRTILRTAAWSVPIVSLAAVTPAHAASGPCAPVNVSYSSGNWTTAFAGTTSSGTCGGVQPEASGRYWLWCDAPAASNYTMTRTVTFSVVAGTTYSIAYSMQANQGAPTPSSGQTLTIAIGYATPTTVKTYQSQTGLLAGATLLPNAGTGGANFSVVNDDFDFTAATTGTVTLTYTHTARARGSAVSTDDIGISAPTISCA